MRLSTNQGVCLDELVSTNVIVYTVHVSNCKLILVLVDLWEQEHQWLFYLLLSHFIIVILANTLLTFRITNDRTSSWAIVACNCETPRQESNRIFSDINSGGFSDAIKPLRPLFISDSWGSEGYYFHIFKFLSCPDINKADRC